MDLDARLDLNTRVLRRTDPHAAQILGVASFAVLYSYEKDWVFNRNGPENFVVGVTPEDDIELTNEFIIYRPESDTAGAADEGDIYGIWIFEPSQLEQFGKMILDLQKAPYPPKEPAPGPIDIDALFGAAHVPQKQNGQAHVFTESERTGASILNALFRDAAPAALAEASSVQANDSSTPPVAETLTVEQRGASINFDDLFAGQAPHSKEEDAAPHSDADAGADADADADAHSRLARLLNGARLEERVPRDETLQRDEFVHALVSLLYKDASLVDDLYARYLAR
ncbi:hypothetical protein MVES_001575 [Malassezia vespertilionis]|uniref:Uncharacterized protein n=1 Tax=Malassezia vespertilionis TaxID=2020962 RepID=A0A2N1JDN5_9BASI|nr:hypothetical protein MVES_001575 [Malassezia vespertilionis]